ncbi:MAG TPA: FHA domain-containing serine/threonine-protein kinase [Candidatus Limnocylindrales bacterium]
MTRLVVRVEQGPRQGEELTFEESDNLIVGRDGPKCRAHLRLDPEDRYVSQNHFMLEIRPPNCRVRDLGSKNGTEVRRAGEQAWSRVDEEEELSSGDEVRVGETVLSIVLEMIGEPARQLQCIRCLAPLEDAVEPASGSISYRDVDFLCGRCRAEVEAERSRIPEPAFRCSGVGCGKDVTKQANADGRAGELADVAEYLCEECAEQQRHIARTYIGGYLLLAELGFGGMGIVYRVWHPDTGRVAALKQLLRPLQVPPAKRQRFRREVALLQQLTHPGVTRLFEAGEDDDVPFFISEFVPDGHVGQFVSDDGEPLLSPEASARLMADALVGIAVVHEQGIVHRDLKPENVLLRRADGSLVPKVADFGLARSYEVHGGTITGTGEFGGTLAYLPPEQIVDFKGSKPSVDVYSAGVCLYYLLTGLYPLDFPTPWQMQHRTSLVGGGALPNNPIDMALTDKRKPIQERRPDLPGRLAAVVDHAVARDTERRIQTAEQLRADLLAAVEAAP